jgi:hypothetical protein
VDLYLIEQPRPEALLGDTFPQRQQAGEALLAEGSAEAGGAF